MTKPSNGSPAGESSEGVPPVVTKGPPAGGLPGGVPPAVRVEHDSMGEVLVPADALWGAQTQRAVENFPISGEPLSRDMIGALASIKGSAAVVNGELGVLPADMTTAIHDAAAAVSRGSYDDQFPIDVFQTGSGTSSNMNANEVIATLAARAPRAAGAPQRSRQRVAVVQRRVPVRNPPGRRPADRACRCCPRCVIWPQALGPSPPSSPTSSRAAGRI